MMITILGDPRTKKNSMRPVTISTKGGESFTRLLPSKAYEDYEKDCMKQIAAISRQSIKKPVNVKCLYYMRTRRIVDLVNLLEATNDILVKAGVLSDDNSRVVISHDGSRVLYDKTNPRVEITITEDNKVDLQLQMEDL